MDQEKMVLTCKSCGKTFSSTFSVGEMEDISQEQYEAGTLHLCPHCGNLSMYLIRDYHEPDKQCSTP
jgi:DNA-directed RNA polymerase subunit RPC12/RpoP